MLSILIPIYQYNIYPLVRELCQQGQRLTVPWEIICLDDDSEVFWKNQNRAVGELPGVQYQELSQNMGRARIRNKLAAMAQFEYLLFLDCDSGVIRPDFLEKYVCNLHPRTVLCGGRIYSMYPPREREYILHWAYGKEREERPAYLRREMPHHAFMTNNFVVPAEVMANYPFSDQLTQYGHEDTLFGLTLEQANIPVFHLDNPLEHLGLESTDVFLAKARQALENLAFLRKQNLYIETRLTEVYDNLEQQGMIRLIRWMLRIFRPAFLQNLRSPNPNLRFFDAYKLECFIHAMRN